MHTRTLGQGLEVSAIGLGAMGMSQSYGPNPGDRAAMVDVLESQAVISVRPPGFPTRSMRHAPDHIRPETSVPRADASEMNGR